MFAPLSARQAEFWRRGLLLSCACRTSVEFSLNMSKYWKKESHTSLPHKSTNNWFKYLILSVSVFMSHCHFYFLLVGTRDRDESKTDRQTAGRTICSFPSAWWYIRLFFFKEAARTHGWDHVISPPGTVRLWRFANVTCGVFPTSCLYVFVWLKCLIKMLMVIDVFARPGWISRWTYIFFPSDGLL